MNPYHQLVSEYARLAREGKGWPLGGFPDCSRPAPAPEAPTVLIFSPHPDDEVIIGGLALRLLREAQWRVVNVAVTQGSNLSRQSARLAELKACCHCIGFDLVTTGPDGLERVNVQTRGQDPEYWRNSVRVIADLLRAHQPRVMLFPHDDDWNSTHIGTHHLVADALKSLGPDFQCFTVETEFWGAMKTPNLMVEISPRDLGDLITALTFHVGEVKRNPYHLTLPAWMMDNVRRGGEVAGGQGGAAPDFAFATLYRLRRWQDGQFTATPGSGRAISSAENVKDLF